MTCCSRRSPHGDSAVAVGFNVHLLLLAVISADSSNAYENKTSSVRMSPATNEAVSISCCGCGWKFDACKVSVIESSSEFLESRGSRNFPVNV